jgi:hypothetical protein
MTARFLNNDAPLEGFEVGGGQRLRNGLPVQRAANAQNGSIVGRGPPLTGLKLTTPAHADVTGNWRFSVTSAGQSAAAPLSSSAATNRTLNTSWWLHDYFPAAYRLVAGRTYPAERIAEVLGPVEVVPVPVPADCTDGFEAAYWRRPEAILDPAVWRPTSALSLIPASDRAAGMARLSGDLASGRWHQKYGHLLALHELDLGYCIVVARR